MQPTKHLQSESVGDCSGNVEVGESSKVVEGGEDDRVESLEPAQSACDGQQEPEIVEAGHCARQNLFVAVHRVWPDGVPDQQRLGSATDPGLPHSPLQLRLGPLLPGGHHHFRRLW